MWTINGEDEQWKTDGVCEKCYRQSYCSHHCTMRKKRDKRNLLRLERDIMGKLFSDTLLKECNDCKYNIGDNI